jgi:hypothetical protein
LKKNFRAKIKKITLTNGKADCKDIATLKEKKEFIIKYKYKKKKYKNI